MTTVARAFNTDYNEHVGLIHNFARKGWGRMVQANVDMDYEDVFQEMSLTYTKALNTYDPERGVGFTAYMGRAIWNDFNRVAEKRIAEKVELGMTSIHALENDDDDNSWVDNILKSDVRSPQEELERKQEIVHKLRSLSQTAKFLVAQLVAPSPEVEAAFAAHQANLRSTGGNAPKNMSLGFIGRHYKIGQTRLTAAVQEIRDNYGV